VDFPRATAATVSRRLVAPVLMAALLAAPRPATAGEVRWLAPDAEDADLWRAVIGAVWRGDPITVDVWYGAWPPIPDTTPSADDGADTADVPWTCWLLEEEGEKPRIAIAVEGLDDHLHVPLQGEDQSHEAAIRTAVILTMSLRRTIGIADAGWLPAADLATLLGADVQPRVEEEPPPTPVEEVAEVEPPVETGPTPVRPWPEIGLGVGPGLRPPGGDVALGLSAHLAVRRGPWIGPGPLLALETGGVLTTDTREIGVTRVLIAGRWQFTPATGRLSFPLGVGLGVAITRAQQLQPVQGEANIGVPPVLWLDAGVRARLAPIFTLALGIQAAVDLLPVRVVVEGGIGREEVDLSRVALTPRLEIVFHPPIR